MILKASNCADLSYSIHCGKVVTFIYKSNKRIKTKVLEMLKHNHDIDAVNKKLKQYNVQVILTSASKQYKHYVIIDID
jgi:hypothetical protein